MVALAAAVDRLINMGFSLSCGAGVPDVPYGVSEQCLAIGG
jgi:hypothetical protein